MSNSDPRWDTWKKFRGNRNAVIGSVIVLCVVLIATLSGVIAPHDYSDTSLWDVWAPPGGEFVLGADELGRDILSRLIVGARVSITIAGIVLAITMTVGITLGMLAAYHGGWLDTIVMRTVDVIFAFPELIFAILIAAVLGPGTTSVIVALSLVWWPGIARLTRSLALSVRNELFVDAARVAGTPSYLILWRHILPNILAPLIVRASIGVGFIITAEATLSFLGIGVQEPLPSWGGMIRDGLSSLRLDPYLAMFSSCALGITIIGFNLLGDGLRDVFDPRAEGRR
jgi:ABC-type dipeptide/oligopeptide/nickel transport system permease subunit